MENEKRKLRILIVDDSDVILSSLRSFFEDYNFEVEVCYNGLEGLKKANEFHPDLIFLDLLMPNLDGIKTLQVKKVFKEMKDIPVIVISANTARKNVLAALEAGADKVISKPLKKETIIKYVDEILGGKFFSKQTENKISEDENREMKKHLAGFFVETFPTKRKMIENSIETRNEEMLKLAVHEIRGAGGTIGYPELSYICEEIEDKGLNSQTDWLFAELKTKQIFQRVNEIKKIIKE